jgi:hypothetical protein
MQYDAPGLFGKQREGKPHFFFSKCNTIMKNTIISIMVIGLALFLAFTFGKCSGKKSSFKVETVTKTDTLFNTDTLYLPNDPTPIVQQAKTLIRTQRELTATRMTLRSRERYFASILAGNRRAIDSLESIVSAAGNGAVGFPIGLNQDLLLNLYEGDTISPSGITVGWRIKTLGELFEKPRLTINSRQVTFTVTNTNDRTKDRAIGVLGGWKYNWQNEQTVASLGMYYRRGAWVIGGKPSFDLKDIARPVAFEMFTGFEIGWQQKRYVGVSIR